ncbi:MAG: hypothetical protein QM495_07365 [Lutibacter sp.]|uniref:hypothetical protein n=1 Tax=Lutibacter sp. TaxID=1925666 RepID=UPI0038589342
MKKLLLLILILSFFSCNKSPKKIEILQNQIDSLKTKLNNIYQPGFGELMGNIQSHHSKLWFAGKNQNWKLADFEVKELKEIIVSIKKYQKERTESKLIEMINPALDSVSKAIDKENIKLFKHSYLLLTNSCNSCHKSTNFEYNIVKTPDVSPFSNQDFNLKNSKTTTSK